MDFMLVDSSGNAVDAFDTDVDAVAAFVALIRAEPVFAKNVALVAFDEDGLAVGEPLVAADLLPNDVTTTVVAGAGWLKLPGAAGATFMYWAQSVATLAVMAENGPMLPQAA